MLQKNIALSQRLFVAAERHPELQALTQSLSIATLRFVPADAAGDEAYLNELNQKLLTALEESGEAFASNAVVGGKFAPRFCIVNFRTTADDIDSLPGFVVRLGRAIHARR